MVEAIKAALSALPQQSVVLRYLLSGAGDVTVSDVDLAAASGGLVLAFNLEPEEARPRERPRPRPLLGTGGRRGRGVGRRRCALPLPPAAKTTAAPARTARPCLALSSDPPSPLSPNHRPT